MAIHSIRLKDFPISELQEAVRFYEELQAQNIQPTSPHFSKRFRCGKLKADTLRSAAEWAVKVKAKGI